MLEPREVRSVSSERSHGLNREELKREASETKDELRDAARQQAESLLDRQKAAAADQAAKVTTVLHKMADEFERQEQPYFSGCVNELALRRLHAQSARTRPGLPNGADPRLQSSAPGPVHGWGDSCRFHVDTLPAKFKPGRFVALLSVSARMPSTFANVV